MRWLRPHLLTLVYVIPMACTPSTEVEPKGTPSGEVQQGLCPDDPFDFERPVEWQSASHCSGVEANYNLLFADDQVHRIDIVVSAENHQATMDDLASLLSGGGPASDDAENPTWVPVNVGFAGQWWSQVGMRYKGNSSLRSAWQMGVRKLSFRLGFDKYEDQHPELHNQRFFGFKKMTFSNGFKDDSLIRDKLAADIFRAAGIPAARGAFARVYLDHGEGPVYLGLYTMIEDPSNKMLDSQFEDDSGNLYKPEGQGAMWGSFVEEHFGKKTNEEQADFSDIIAAFEALHASTRSTDAQAWRIGLEQVLDVHGFLRCLAVNQSMVNWDSYGFMNHNYYLYADPADPQVPGRLRWFPWDLNEAMLIQSRGPAANADSVLLDEIGNAWPLIRYLLDDEVYRQRYAQELDGVLQGAFAIASVQANLQQAHDLVAPYVVGAEGEQSPYTFLRDQAAFEQSLSGPTGLLVHVEARHQAVTEALEGME